MKVNITVIIVQHFRSVTTTHWPAVFFSRYCKRRRKPV